MAYGDRTLFRDLDFTVAPGTMVALTGASGSGKSTLLNCIGCLIKPTAGRIEFESQTISAMRPRAVRRFRKSTVGYLFQNYALVEDCTVRDNMMIATRARGQRGSDARNSITRALATVGVVGRLDDRVAKLSGGEQQRVALARLLVKRPRLVLADEPTGALDSVNSSAVISVLQKFAADGACVVVATHDEVVRGACDDQVSL
ncbi:MAG: ABC transporter ATP-binding protein [Nocardioides sp.]